jgi:GNAT superfamily N-acetyltransferase
VTAAEAAPAGLARLCADALPHEDLTADDLERCCFGPGERVVTHADGANVAAAAYVVRDFPEHGLKVAWLLLLVVAPERQRTGAGRSVVERVLDECRREGVLELHTGNAAPRYVWPGVDLSEHRCARLLPVPRLRGLRPRTQHVAADVVPRAVPVGRHDRT